MSYFGRLFPHEPLPARQVRPGTSTREGEEEGREEGDRGDQKEGEKLEGGSYHAC